MRLIRKLYSAKELVESSAEVLDKAVEGLGNVLPSKTVRGRFTNVRKYLISPFKKRRHDS